MPASTIAALRMSHIAGLRTACSPSAALRLFGDYTSTHHQRI
jgi:hypothetical protein